MDAKTHKLQPCHNLSIDIVQYTLLFSAQSVHQQSTEAYKRAPMRLAIALTVITIFPWVVSLIKIVFQHSDTLNKLTEYRRDWVAR